MLPKISFDQELKINLKFSYGAQLNKLIAKKIETIAGMIETRIEFLEGGGKQWR